MGTAGSGFPSGTTSAAFPFFGTSAAEGEAGGQGEVVHVLGQEQEAAELE